jgi:uncharacterized protein (DUF362 family)/Pyruvate/2-oxoacid:ferredoxin oxidoreductase delta subunit
MSEKNLIAIERIHDDDVKSAVSKALADIKAEDLFKEGMTILLKPNLLNAKPPERAVTTHPKVLTAIIDWLDQFHPKKIYVADSSGGMKPGVTEKVLKVSQLEAVCERYDHVEALSFEKTSRKTYVVPNPLVMNEITSSELFDTVDLVINLPKIKTHMLCTLTCSIKNMFGAIIIGNKGKTHLDYPKYSDFSSALADIYSAVVPHLTIVDGYLCQEGKGPSAGDVVKMDIILAGYNGVGIDTTVCKIIGMEPQDVLHLVKASEKGLGSINIADYQIVGESIQSVYRKFKRPEKAGMSIPLPPKFAKWVSKQLFRPQITFDLQKCTLCGTCWRDCPANAIHKPKNMKPSTEIPDWNKKNCIFCYCCSELCPNEAVDFEVNIVKNALFSKVGLLLFSILGSIALIIWALVKFL